MTMRRVVIAVGVLLLLGGIAFSIPAFHAGGNSQPGAPAVLPQSAVAAPVIPPPAVTATLARVEEKTPAYVAPIVKDPHLAVFVNRLSSVNDRLFDDMASFLPSITTPVDIAAVRFVLHDKSEIDVIRHEAANLLVRSNTAGLDMDFITIAEDPRDGDRFRGWAVQHLSTLLVESQETYLSAGNRLRRFLGDGPIEVRREALLGLARLNDPVAKQTALHWLRTTPAVPDSLIETSLRSLSEMDPSEIVGPATLYVVHPSETVRVAAIVALGESTDPTALAVLERVARDPKTTLRAQRAAAGAKSRIEAAIAASSKAAPTAAGLKEF